MSLSDARDFGYIQINEGDESPGSSHVTLAISSDSVLELVPNSLDAKDIQQKAASSSASSKAAENEARRKVRVGVMMSIGYIIDLRFISIHI